MGVAGGGDDFVRPDAEVVRGRNGGTTAGKQIGGEGVEIVCG